MKNLLVLFMLITSSLIYGQSLSFPTELNLSTTEDLEPIGSNDDGAFYFDWEKGRIVGVNNNKFISSQEKIWETVDFIEIPNSRTRWTVIDNYILVSFIQKDKNIPKLYCMYIDTKSLTPSKNLSKIILFDPSYKFGTNYAEFYNMYFISSPDNKMAVLPFNTIGDGYNLFLNFYEFTQNGVEEIKMENNTSILINEEVKTCDDFYVTNSNEIVFLATNYFHMAGLPSKSQSTGIKAWLCKLNLNGKFAAENIGSDFSKFTSLDYDDNTISLVEYRYIKASKNEPFLGKTSGKYLNNIVIRVFNEDLSLKLENDIETSDNLSFLTEVKDEVIPFYSYTNNHICIFVALNFERKTTSSTSGNTSNTSYSHNGYAILFIDNNLKLSSYKTFDAGLNGKTFLEYARFALPYVYSKNNYLYFITNNNLRFFKDDFGKGEDISELLLYKINVDKETIESETILSYSESNLIARLYSTNVFTKTIRSLNGSVTKIPLTFIKRGIVKNVPSLTDKTGDFYFGILDLIE